LPLADGALERWTACKADSVVADHRIEPILTLEKPPKADRVAARGVRCGEHLARRSQTTPEKQRADSTRYFASRSDPVMSRVVLRVPVVLRGKIDGQGGTERGTRWYRCRVIDLPVPPGPTSQYPLRRGIPLRVPPGTTGTPSMRADPETTMWFVINTQSGSTVWPPPKPSRQPLWRDLSRCRCLLERRRLARYKQKRPRSIPGPLVQSVEGSRG
jgi:hypothetical protein